MIKQLLKKIIKQKGYLLIKQGVYLLVNPTSEERVKSLIEKLYPYQIKKDLIRIGPKGDGGYLIPDDLEGVKACFSPGVNQISEFEQDCNKLGMEVFMADKSVDKPNLNIPPDQYNFIKKHIGCTNNSVYITMDEWVNSSWLNEDEDLILQMDIEGGEYLSLINTSDSLMKRFRILVIEFHFLQDLWNPHFFEFAEVVFDKILQTHSCVHIHPNNIEGISHQYGIGIPKVAEFTFLRNDRTKFENYKMQFPHELDYDNTNNESIVLPQNWHKSI
ncbi:hypothetical protein ACFLR8_00535 [Bacteroidota bacterium]